RGSPRRIAGSGPCARPSEVAEGKVKKLSIVFIHGDSKLVNQVQLRDIAGLMVLSADAKSQNGIHQLNG
ncbi:MAG: hypothetical protein WCE66_12735, partial [Azonexus sp.]